MPLADSCEYTLGEQPGVGSVVRVAAWDPRVLSSSPIGRWINTHQGVTQPVILPRSANWVPACWDNWAIGVSCDGVATRPGLCPTAQETASAAPTLYRVWFQLLLLFTHGFTQRQSSELLIPWNGGAWTLGWICLKRLDLIFLKRVDLIFRKKVGFVGGTCRRRGQNIDILNCGTPWRSVLILL